MTAPGDSVRIPVSLLLEFVAEAGERLDVLKGLASGLRSDEEGRRDFAVLARSVKSLRDGADFLGLRRVSLLLRKLAKVLDAVVGNRLYPSRSVIEGVCECLDAVSGILYRVGSGQAEISDRGHFERLSRRLDDLAGGGVGQVEAMLWEGVFDRLKALSERLAPRLGSSGLDVRKCRALWKEVEKLSGDCRRLMALGQERESRLAALEKERNAAADGECSSRPGEGGSKEGQCPEARSDHDSGNPLEYAGNGENGRNVTGVDRKAGGEAQDGVDSVPVKDGPGSGVNPRDKATDGGAGAMERSTANGAGALPGLLASALGRLKETPAAADRPRRAGESCADTGLAEQVSSLLDEAGRTDCAAEPVFPGEAKILPFPGARDRNTGRRPDRLDDVLKRRPSGGGNENRDPQGTS